MSSPSINLTFMGDSKTQARGFQPDLLIQTNAAEAPTQLATSGWKVSDLEAATDAWLLAATDTPSRVLINIGINDISDGTSQGTFEAKLGSILDKVHAKWASAAVFVARVWKRGADAACNTMDNVWIPNVLATRSSFAFAGIDERVILKRDDNGGMAMSTDGTHPNSIGYYLTSRAWKAAMGL